MKRIAPFVVLAATMLLGGWFFQEGVRRDRGVFTQSRLFQEVVDHVSDQFVEPVERERIYRAAIEGLLDELDDPHSSFIEAREYEDLRIRTQGDYGGVGLEVIERDGWVTVVGIIPGTPGARSGIRAGDQFFEVAGRSTEGLDVDAVVDLLRGPPGEAVEVLMRRSGVDEPISFSLQREVIQIKSVPFALQLADGVGYVPLQVFRSTSTDEVRAAVDSLRAEGVERLILDLRGNPGGLLEEGIGVTELFLDAGETVVETRGRGAGQTERYQTSSQAAYPRMPLVVLVDHTSASASEIVAGALQDHDRALVLGSSTYGKGSVQTLFRLSEGNVLRLTTALWYTPAGRSIDREVGDGVARMEGGLGLDGSFVASPDTAGRPEFRSMGGRLLRGGGGIVPDEWVSPDTLSSGESEAVQALYRQAGLFSRAIFDHAVDYVSTHDGLSPDFELSAAEVEGFRRRLEQVGVELEAGVFDEARGYIVAQLSAEIALQAFGEVGVFQRDYGRDAALNRALDRLQQATTTRDLLALLRLAA
jgi:carboxyl-terminal processing protease